MYYLAECAIVDFIVYYLAEDISVSSGLYSVLPS